jgi:hypothetical protein
MGSRLAGANSVAPKADTDGLGSERLSTDTGGGLARSAAVLDGLARWHTSDQLADATQAKLTTMSDHNDARRNHIGAG